MIPACLVPSSLAIQSMLPDEATAQPWKADVVAAKRGDHSAFASLVRSTQRSIYGLCWRLLHSESESSEVAQEAFLRAYQHLDRFDEERPFDVWVMAIARNLCMDVLRRRSRMKPTDVDEMRETLPSTGQSQLEGALEREERVSLDNALLTLSAEDREILALYYVQKRTTKEIAQVIGLAPGSIMARLFRAREKLRRQMTAAEGAS